MSSERVLEVARQNVILVPFVAIIFGIYPIIIHGIIYDVRIFQIVSYKDILRSALQNFGYIFIGLYGITVFRAFTMRRPWIASFAKYASPTWVLAIIISMTFIAILAGRFLGVSDYYKLFIVSAINTIIVVAIVMSSIRQDDAVIFHFTGIVILTMSIMIPTSHMVKFQSYRNIYPDTICAPECKSAYILFILDDYIVSRTPDLAGISFLRRDTVNNFRILRERMGKS